MSLKDVYYSQGDDNVKLTLVQWKQILFQICQDQLLLQVEITSSRVARKAIRYDRIIASEESIVRFYFMVF